MNKKFKCSAVMACIFIFFLCSCSDKAPANDEIKIGAVISLSGNLSGIGKSSKNGLEFACDKINKSGGIRGKKIKIIYADDKSNPNTASSAVEKLISEDNAAAIIGPDNADSVISSARVCEENKIPMISCSGFNIDNIKGKAKYVFSIDNTDTSAGKALSDFALNNLKYKTCAILSNTDNMYSSDVSKAFKDEFEKQSGKIVYNGTYSNKSSDFSSILANVKSSSPDLVFIPDFYSNVQTIVKQAKELGIKSVFMSGEGLDIGGRFEKASEKTVYESSESKTDFSEGMYFCTHFSADDISPAATEFSKSFEEKYNNPPDSQSALAYDAASVLFSAIEKAQSDDSEKIKSALKETEIKGVTGKIDFSENQFSKTPIDIIHIENNKQKLISRINFS